MKRIVMMMLCGVFAAAGLTVCAEEPQKAAESGVTSITPGTGANDPYVPPINVDQDLPGNSIFEAELSHPSRSYVDSYSEKDPAFSKFVDVSLLSSAMASPDASQLIDVALGLSEGERVLVRTHESGLTADNLMAKAVKLAISSGDTASVERIGKAATAHGREQWAKLLTDAKEFGGASRDGAAVPISKIDAEAAILIQNVRQACNVAMLTGQKADLEAAKKDVATSKADESIKSHLNEMIEGNLKSIPDVADDTQKLLAEFSAGSRGYTIPGTNIGTDNTPFDPKTYDQTGRDIDRERLNIMDRNPRAGRDYTKVYLANKSNKRIWAAIRVVPYDFSRGQTSRLKSIGEGPFETLAWFSLAPGQRSHVANTSNSHVYTYAKSDNGSVWSGRHGVRVGGDVLQFNSGFIIGNPEEYTHNFGN